MNTSMLPDKPELWAVLMLPGLRVQNANAISSPMTWGFPAMTAFLGLMTALERRLGPSAGISFKAVGVICHDFEAQVTTEGFTRSFHLTRNPVGADGSTVGIVEAGRVHLELTLVFRVLISSALLGATDRQALVDRVAHELSGMRMAGGSVMPSLLGYRRGQAKPCLALEAKGQEAQRLQMRQIARACPPGFALVSRADLLDSHLTQLRASAPEANALDAWLDLSRSNSRAVQSSDGQVSWQTDERPGWIVPIPIGYTALSELFSPGTVSGTRDTKTHFRFVETIWSLGEWVNSHRLKSLVAMLWYARTESETQATYLCCNDYIQGNTADSATA